MPIYVIIILSALAGASVGFGICALLSVASDADDLMPTEPTDRASTWPVEEED
jgi:hypothetical protein